MVEIKPIGMVRNEAKSGRAGSWRELVSEIIIDPEHSEALYRLEDFSHIYVLFYLHEMDRPFRTKIHPRGNPRYPLMGAFATRTPNRPSRIGLTLCKLESREGNILTVRGLDAFDGSPVLDIKPYTHFPVEGEVRLPEWAVELREDLYEENHSE